MTAPSEDGDGPARCMAAAFKDAKINADQVRYLNAHGTSTPLGDVAETLAIKRALGDHAYKTMVSSTKSMTGHLLGAAGGCRSGVLGDGAAHGIIPPTINLENPGEGCDLDYVPNVAREKQIDIAVSNGFGFGGTQRYAGVPPHLTQERGSCSSRINSTPRTRPAWTTATGRRRRVIRCCSNPARTARAGALGHVFVRRQTLRLDRDGIVRDKTTASHDGELSCTPRSRVRPRCSARRTALAVRGGWAVFLAYELGRSRTGVAVAGRASVALPVHALRSPRGRVARPCDGRVFAIAEVGRRDWIDTILADAQAAASLSPLPEWRAPASIEEGRTRALHARRRARHRTPRRGRRVPGESLARLARAFRCAVAAANCMRVCAPRIRAVRRPVRGGRMGDRQFLARAPGSIRGDAVETRPIAGTRPRLPGDDEAARIRELVGHPKERAEHVMLIDLERNDLGRVCTPGQRRGRRTDDRRKLRARAPHRKQRARTPARGRHARRRDPRRVSRRHDHRVARKCAACRIIAALEGQGRGAYTGAFGWLNRDGDLDLNILIRSAELEGDTLRFRTGAGIVIDSIPQRELDETRAKARGITARIGRGRMSGRSFIGDHRVDALPGDARGFAYGDGVFETMPRASRHGAVVGRAFRAARERPGAPAHPLARRRHDGTRDRRVVRRRRQAASRS
jgi:anthranilate synthase component 1